MALALFYSQTGTLNYLFSDVNFDVIKIGMLS